MAYYYYCCQCSDGLHNASLNIDCPSCFHPFCIECTQVPDDPSVETYGDGPTTSNTSNLAHNHSTNTNPSYDYSTTIQNISHTSQTSPAIRNMVNGTVSCSSRPEAPPNWRWVCCDSGCRTVNSCAIDAGCASCSKWRCKFCQVFDANKQYVD